MKELIEWLLFPGRPELNTKDVKRAVGSTDELERAVLEAIQLLEHAELILGVQITVGAYEQHYWRATRLGLEAADNGEGRCQAAHQGSDRPVVHESPSSY